MNEKQKMFADEYLKDMNATRAYKCAYPDCGTDENARAASSRLLTNVNIKSYIDEQLEQIHSKNVADIQEVFEYLTSVMRGEQKTEELMNVGVGVGMTEVQKVEKTTATRDRLKAAELLGKAYSMFTDNVNAKVEVPTFVGESEIEK